MFVVYDPFLPLYACEGPNQNDVSDHRHRDAAHDEGSELTLMPESTLTPAPVRTAVLPLPFLRKFTIKSTESGMER